jgi:FixJ family two-component response regulator
MLDEIILIDDDNIVNTINTLFINKVLPGVNVKSFDSGEKGLVYLISMQDSLKKTLVFLDINMPVMNGFQFLTIYENAIAYQDHSFAICLLTGSIDKNDKKKASKYPSVLAYTQKPLNKKKILRIIARADSVFANQSQHE